MEWIVSLEKGELLVFSPLYPAIHNKLTEPSSPDSVARSRCRFTHDIPTYLTSKTADVHWPSPSSSAAQISTTAPYVPPLDEYRKPHSIYPSVDTATICPIWQELGECRWVVLLVSD